MQGTERTTISRSFYETTITYSLLTGLNYQEISLVEAGPGPGSRGCLTGKYHHYANLEYFVLF